jgi:hypothetical protein
MTTNLKRHKTLLFFVGTLAVLTLLDLSPMLYQRLFGNGGNYVKYYKFDISGDSLLTVLTSEFGLTKVADDKPYITTIELDTTDCSYVQLYYPMTNDYIHLWVRTSQRFTTGTEIIFYGISNSPDFLDSKIINRDYDYIFRKLTTDKFERLIIDRINEKGGI